jgi:hypothetical protein
VVVVVVSVVVFVVFVVVVVVLVVVVVVPSHSGYFLLSSRTRWCLSLQDIS